eukprot:TRINITY_DN148_c0_g1_i1.p3 TRINITY_DN148_c0_g1~~TRINITY_DN148_c0_g1_i1.p3  ORF type:complete len:156 (-),score=17.39 TRINITY_DN148_c0_g1_i1:835-1302(-)
MDVMMSSQQKFVKLFLSWVFVFVGAVVGVVEGIWYCVSQLLAVQFGYSTTKTSASTVMQEELKLEMNPFTLQDNTKGTDVDSAFDLQTEELGQKEEHEESLSQLPEAEVQLEPETKAASVPESVVQLIDDAWGGSPEKERKSKQRLTRKIRSAIY